MRDLTPTLSGPRRRVPRARIAGMQRPVAALVLAAVSMLAGLRLAVAAQDTEAMRCAIACGHAAPAAKGAACCPMSGSGPSFRACAGGDGLALIPLATGQPALLAATAPLTAPAIQRFLDAPPEAGPRLPPARIRAKPSVSKLPARQNPGGGGGAFS